MGLGEGVRWTVNEECVVGEEVGISRGERAAGEGGEAKIATCRRCVNDDFASVLLEVISRGLEKNDWLSE
jgi:hypothetical protein